MKKDNVSTIEILGAAILGAIGGAILALTYVFKTGGF